MAWSRGKRVVRSERGLEFRSISELSWSVLSQALLDLFPAGDCNCSIFFLSFLDPSEWRRDFSNLCVPSCSWLPRAQACRLQVSSGGSRPASPMDPERRRLWLMNTEGFCIASNHAGPAVGREPGQHREPGDHPTSLLYVVFSALNTPEQDHRA